MNGVSEGAEESLRRSDVVDESSDGHDLSLIACFLPLSEDGGNEGALEVAVEHLTKEVYVGDEGTHENDGHVGGIEQTDGIRGVRSGFVIRQLEGHFEALEVNDHKEDKHSTKDIAQVRQTFSKESIIEGTQLVFSEEDAVEQFDEGAFVLFDFCVSSFVFEGEGREAIPDDCFSHVDCDEN